jgi:hypothetical protein
MKTYRMRRNRNLPLPLRHAAGGGVPATTVVRWIYRSPSRLPQGEGKSLS